MDTEEILITLVLAALVALITRSASSNLPYHRRLPAPFSSPLAPSQPTNQQVHRHVPQTSLVKAQASLVRAQASQVKAQASLVKTASRRYQVPTIQVTRKSLSPSSMCPDNYTTINQVSAALRKAGLESSELIVGEHSVRSFADR